MSRNTFNASCLPMAFAVAVNALKLLLSMECPTFLLVARRQIADAASRTHKSVAGSMVETALGGRTERRTTVSYYHNMAAQYLRKRRNNMVS